jgi:hypothetical protein
MRDQISAGLGPFDAGNPRWYGWLSEKLLRYGSERETRTLMQDFLRRPVSPQALLKQIRRLKQLPPVRAGDRSSDPARLRHDRKYSAQLMKNGEPGSFGSRAWQRAAAMRPLARGECATRVEAARLETARSTRMDFFCARLHSESVRTTGLVVERDCLTQSWPQQGDSSWRCTC